MVSTGIATGKIILSGEYAMAFGFSGIAFPSRETMRVRFRPTRKGGLTVIFKPDDFHPEWAMYAGQAAECIARHADIQLRGELSVDTDLPLGKGMGSSTALVIAVARALLGKDCREAALAAEDEMNPGHSGMDFSVIWEGRPILFRKGSTPTPVTLPSSLPKHVTLIDAGMPNEQTPVLVAWVKSRGSELEKPLQIIGACTERILSGEDLKTVLRDHHRAQVALGVVPSHAQTIVEGIERHGGAAKVIGAGGRTGGGGMILALH